MHHQQYSTQHDGKINSLHNSGTYPEHYKDCNIVYIGQTKRKLTQRHQDHIKVIGEKQQLQSAVAPHMIEYDPTLDEANLKKFKNCQK